MLCRPNHTATVFFHVALLSSKSYNSQHAGKLYGPWAGGAYKLTLALTGNPAAIYGLAFGS